MRKPNHPNADMIEQIGRALAQAMNDYDIGFALIAHLPHTEDAECHVMCVGNLPPDTTIDMLKETAQEMEDRPSLMTTETLERH